MRVAESAKPWMRTPSDDLAVAQGCYFDHDAGQFVCDFIETFCVQSKGRWAGQPVKLLPWQRDFVMRLFGWKERYGLRRFRRAYLEIPKKNGKSTLLTCIALYLLLGDGEGAPEIYLNACDRDQASIIFEEARRMVEASPDFSDRLEVINSKTDRRIVFPSANGVVIANSSMAASKDGLNASASIFDELHRQDGRELWDVFEYAGASREQPLRLSITTAGESEEGVWFEERDHAEKVLAGDVLDTAFLGVVYRAQPTDDLDDPEVWKTANPSLGETIKLEDFAREYTEAKLIPVKLSNFKRLRLGIISGAAAKFFPDGAWVGCDRPTTPLDQLRKRPCWAGLDLASVNDLTALVWIFGDARKGYDVFAKFYLPGDNIVELGHKHRAPYQVWEESGAITITPGASVDYDFVREDVLKIAADHDLRGLFLDPCNATSLYQRLKDQDGLPVEMLRQGTFSLNAPTKELLRLVLAGKIRHGNHPILRWNASNCTAVRDVNDNIRLSKKLSGQKIDGMAALVNALAAASTPDSKPGPSVYETRGLLFL